MSTNLKQLDSGRNKMIKKVIKDGVIQNWVAEKYANYYKLLGP